MRRELRVLSDLGAAAAAAADCVAEVAAECIAARGRFSLALAGGKTPAALYERLGAKSLRWERTEAYFGDERCVPPSDPDSNYAMARRTLLSRVPLPAVEVHRIEAERGAAPAAALYEGVLREHFAPERPALDLALLGLGADGHTASLFPGAAALQEARWVSPATAPPGAGVRERVTLTLAFLALARRALFLVAGAEKSEAVAAVLDASPAGRTALPAACVCPTEAVYWFLDSAAASRLGARPLPAGDP